MRRPIARASPSLPHNCRCSSLTAPPARLHVIDVPPALRPAARHAAALVRPSSDTDPRSSSVPLRDPPGRALALR
ncbi:hypothetical protein CG017_05910 (plasmid) [Burkholderia glumae]|nr:hypothetical protein CG017_05910 [Burkholderia glumae]